MMKSLRVLLLCFPIIAAPVALATTQTFKATLETSVMATDFNYGGFLDKPKSWNGPDQPSIDIKGGSNPAPAGFPPATVPTGEFKKVTRPENASGSAEFILGEEMTGGFLTKTLSYKINLQGVNVTALGATPTSNNDVVAILINTVTRTYEGVDVGVGGRSGLWMFGVLGPGKALGGGQTSPQWDQNNGPTSTLPVQITKNGDLNFTLAGMWDIRDTLFSDVGGATAAKNINNWYQYLEDGLFYIEVYTKLYPYWTVNSPEFKDQEQSFYNDGGALRGAIVAAAPTADVLSLLGIGLFGWVLSRKGRKLN